MINYFKLLFYLLIFSSPVSAQVVTFNKTYDSGVDIAYSSIEVSDGYLISTSAGFPFTPRKMVITKTDLNGDTLWNKIYGDSLTFDSFYAFIKTSDSNFLTGAYAYDPVLDKIFIKLIKLDSLGDSIWTRKIYATSGFNYYSAYIIETSDHGFLISGQIADTSITDGDGLILKTDSLGNEEWHTIFGGNNFEAIYSSIELADYGFLSLGWTRSFGNGSRDIYLVKTDSSGNFLWQKNWGTFDDEGGIGITSLSNGNYLIAGGGWLNVSTFYGMLTVIDTSGTILTQKYYTNFPTSEFWWARETNGHSIVAAGSNENAAQIALGWIAKFDTALNMQWTRSFIENNYFSVFRDVQQTSDGGYIVSGFVFAGASGGQDSWLVKLDSLGCDSAGCPTITSIEEASSSLERAGVRLFPNPAKEKITLSFSRSLFTAALIKIYDIMGKQVYYQPAFIQKQISIPVYELQSGVYVVEIIYEGVKERVKFVKE